MLEDLMAKGSIRIHDYGIDRRRTMSSTGRCFPFYVMSYLSEGHAVLRLPDREIVQSPHSDDVMIGWIINQKDLLFDIWRYAGVFRNADLPSFTCCSVNRIVIE